MKAIGILAILSFLFGVATRFCTISYMELRERRLTEEMCNFVSISLETGSLKEVFDGLAGGIQTSGFPGACVSVVDNGRSFSPDCMKEDSKYKTISCKAKGNTGVRATVSFPERPLFDAWLVVLSVGFFAMVLLTREVFRGLSTFLTKSFSEEIEKVLEMYPVKKNERKRGAIVLTMEKLGILRTLQDRAQAFSDKLRGYEIKITNELRIKTKLEEQSRLSEEYFGKVQTIRHNIRSPLTSLMTIQSTLGATPEIAAKLGTAIRRIQLFLDDLDEKESVREPKSLVIAEVAIEETAFLMREKFAESKSAKVSVVYDHLSLSPITVGRREFTDSLENLLENALDAISRNGQVIVRVKNFSGTCQIVVEDDGCGLSDGAMEVLFEKGGTHGKIGGTGQGLFATKACVESWGGKIEAANGEKGAKFTIALPITQTGAQFVGLNPQARYRVIDDDDMVAQALKFSGFSVGRCASDFESGQKLLLEDESEPSAVTLVDYRLGDAFGTDLIVPLTNKGRVQLCTNDFDSIDLVKKAREIGVKIVPKPLCFYAIRESI